MTAAKRSLGIKANQSRSAGSWGATATPWQKKYGTCGVRETMGNPWEKHARKNVIDGQKYTIWYLMGISELQLIFNRQIDLNLR